MRRGQTRRLIRMARRQIRRSDRALRMDEGRYNKQQAETMRTDIDALKAAMTGEPDPEKISRPLQRLTRITDQPLPFYKTSTFLEYGEAILIAVIVALFLRTFVIQAFKIPSGSMLPTLTIGDHIMVSKFQYGFILPFTNVKVLPMTEPKRGEIMVFKYPKDPGKDFIKRIVAVPGDRIEVRDGRLYVNGQAVSRTRTGTYTYNHRDYGIREDFDLYQEELGGIRHDIIQDPRSRNFDFPSTEVPPDKFFAMGDNRDHSHDSRFWGFVDFNMIRGKALFIYWSSGNAGGWKRIGKLVR